MFIIYCDGTQSRGQLVVNPHTMEVKRFKTRAEARAYRDSIVPDQPSKFLPLRVCDDSALPQVVLANYCPTH